MACIGKQIAGLLRIWFESSLLFTILSPGLFRLSTFRHLFPPFATSWVLFVPFGLQLSLYVNCSKVLCVMSKIRKLEVPRVIFKVLVPPFAPICPHMPLPGTLNLETGLNPGVKCHDPF
jgi:hypothetical protein